MRCSTWPRERGSWTRSQNPIENFDLNARGTLLALWAAKQAGVGRFVFSSSNAPLGDNAYPASEDKPVAPLSPYGAGKATGEAYCSAFSGAYGFEAVAVRFSNAYGPRSARKSNVIPLFIRKIMAGEPLTIYGDGTQTRDFVFVTDLANGLIRAAETPGAGGEIFQLASGVETSLNDLVAMLAEVSGNSTAAAARAAPRRRDPAQLLAGRQGPRPAGVRPAGAAGRGAGAHLGLVPGRLTSAHRASGGGDVDRHLVGLAHHVLGHLDRRGVDQLAVQRDRALALGRRLLHRLDDPAGPVDLLR